MESMTDSRTKEGVKKEKYEVISPVIETGTLSDYDIQLECERHVITTTPRNLFCKCVREI